MHSSRCRVCTSQRSEKKQNAGLSISIFVPKQILVQPSQESTPGATVFLSLVCVHDALMIPSHSNRKLSNFGRNEIRVCSRLLLVRNTAGLLKNLAQALCIAALKVILVFANALARLLPSLSV